jgi:Cu+-exporting ATPase
MATSRGTSPAPDTAVCVHCGDPVRGEGIVSGDLQFCCSGCKAVYEVLSQAASCPVPAPRPVGDDRFAYLDDPAVIDRLRDFSDGTITAVTFFVPQMHCASCIWLLENLFRFDPGILHSRADFLGKSVVVRYANGKTGLRKVVELLTSLGYEPTITLESAQRTPRREADRSLYARIGIAGFCFGNTMILAFPEYLSGGDFEPFLRSLFAYVSLALSLPVAFYSATVFFRGALAGLRSRVVNLDLPLAVGIAILFVRSAVEILTGTGFGYVDSLCGLVFFLLLGRMFQQRTYDSLNFDRTYASYFPLAVTLKKKDGESTVPVTSLEPGARVIIRNNEIVPADAILMSDAGAIDYSFVTGESTPVPAHQGDLVHAGGRQVGSAIELEVVKTVSQSYLTQLWNEAAFRTDRPGELTRLTNIAGKYFTAALFLVAVSAAMYWFPRDTVTGWNAVTAVLIVACPCALALSTPFAFGTALRVFGRGKFYAKHADVVEWMGRIRTVIFDKTGTLTHARGSGVQFVGEPLSPTERSAVRSLVRNSHHPLSRAVFDALKDDPVLPVADFSEEAGGGIHGTVRGIAVRAGSRLFCGLPPADDAEAPDADGSPLRVFVALDGIPRGQFVLAGQYREGVAPLVRELRKHYKVVLLSGDSDREKEKLGHLFGEDVPLYFHQTPADKLAFVAGVQANGDPVLMVGDGLNDAGALKQADVGVALTDDTTAFSPACDVILDGSRLAYLDRFLRFARSSRTVVLVAYAISVLYNVVGLSFAVRGALSPVIAAVLMPASSITVVAFTSLSLRVLARKRGLL